MFTVNTLSSKLFLWNYSSGGGEAWLLHATLKNKIELFLQHHSIWIFKISMFQVKYNHIHWSDIQERLYNIPSVENMIASRQLLFIGKVVWDPSFDRPEKWCWHQVEIIWYQKREANHNITMKILSWETIFFYSKEYTKCILTLSMELWRVGSNNLATKDIGTRLWLGPAQDVTYALILRYVWKMIWSA